MAVLARERQHRPARRRLEPARDRGAPCLVLWRSWRRAPGGPRRGRPSSPPRPSSAYAPSGSPWPRIRSALSRGDPRRGDGHRVARDLLGATPDRADGSPGSPSASVWLGGTGLAGRRRHGDGAARRRPARSRRVGAVSRGRASGARSRGFLRRLRGDGKAGAGARHRAAAVAAITLRSPRCSSRPPSLTPTSRGWTSSAPRPLLLYLGSFPPRSPMRCSRWGSTACPRPPPASSPCSSRSPPPRSAWSSLANRLGRRGLDGRGPAR